MNTKMLYAEKRDNIDPNAIAIALPNIKIYRTCENTFTINGEDMPFIAMETKAPIEDLKSACSDFYRKGLRAMYSGIIEGTAISGVIRHGNCIGYRSEEERGYFLQTDIIDQRCRISFPLVTKRHVDRRIKFIPLDLVLPTDFNTLERRMKSMHALAEESTSEVDYVENMALCMAIATIVYPPSLIWKHEIPDPIVNLSRAISDGEHSIEIPAYMIMSDEERDFLELDLYTGIADMAGDHLKPMKSVISPSLAATVAKDAGIMERLMGMRTFSDLESMMNTMASIHGQIFGNIRGKMRVSRTGGNVSLHFQNQND